MMMTQAIIPSTSSSFPGAKTQTCNTFNSCFCCGSNLTMHKSGLFASTFLADHPCTSLMGVFQRQDGTREKRRKKKEKREGVCACACARHRDRESEMGAFSFSSFSFFLASSFGASVSTVQRIIVRSSATQLRQESRSRFRNAEIIINETLMNEVGISKVTNGASFNCPTQKQHSTTNEVKADPLFCPATAWPFVSIQLTFYNPFGRLVARMTNACSHIGSFLDRSMVPSSPHQLRRCHDGFRFRGSDMRYLAFFFLALCFSVGSSLMSLVGMTD